MSTPLRERPDAPLGTLIFRAGLLPAETIESALEEGVKTGKRLGEILTERGLISEVDLARLLAGQKGLEFVTLREQIVDPSAAALFTEEQARLFRALPYSFDGELPVVAIADPTDDVLIRNIREALGREDARFVVTARGELADISSDVYSKPLLPAPEARPEQAYQPEPSPETAQANGHAPADDELALEPTAAPAAVPEPETAAAAPSSDELEPAFQVPVEEPAEVETEASVPEPLPAPQPEPQPEPEPLAASAPSWAPEHQHEPEAEPEPDVETVFEPPVAAEPALPEATVLPEPAEQPEPPRLPEPPAAPEALRVAEAPTQPEPVAFEEAAPASPDPVAADPVPFPQPMPAPPSVPYPPAAEQPVPEPEPAPVVEYAATPEPPAQPSPAGAPWRMTIRLTNGERVDAGEFSDEAAAKQEAKAIMMQIAAADQDDWPFVNGRFLKPDTIVSVDIAEHDGDES